MDMAKHLIPGCLAYVKETSPNTPLRGRVVIALRPWADGDVFEIGHDKFGSPDENDIWFIKAARDGELLPLRAACDWEVFFREGPLGVENARHLRRINGPSEDVIEHERIKVWAEIGKSNHIFPDISEVTRTTVEIKLSERSQELSATPADAASLQQLIHTITRGPL